MSPEFQLTSLSDSENQLSIVYNLGMHLNDLRKRLFSADMIDAFRIITPNPSDPNQPLSVNDLLKSCADTTLESVRAHVKFLNYYGQVYDQENLTWSQTLLKNSCKPGTRGSYIFTGWTTVRRSRVEPCSDAPSVQSCRCWRNFGRIEIPYQSYRGDGPV